MSVTKRSSDELKIPPTVDVRDLLGKDSATGKADVNFLLQRICYYTSREIFLRCRATGLGTAFRALGTPEAGRLRSCVTMQGRYSEQEQETTKWVLKSVLSVTGGGRWLIIVMIRINVVMENTP